MTVVGDGTSGDRRLQDRSLLRHRDFLLFWFSETTTTVGGSVSGVAFPLVAVLTLHASAFQVGLLAAMGQIPVFVLGLPAGAWVDRLRHRPVMVLTDIGRCGVMLVVPLSVAFGALHLTTLYVVAAAHAILRTLFEPAWHAYLPALVSRDQLIDANGKVALISTPAEVGGKGLGGLLVQVLGAPFALLADAVGFALAAASLAAIRTAEPRPQPVQGTGLAGQVREGVRLVLLHPVLRVLAGFTAVASFGLSGFYALAMVFLSRTVGVPASLIGLLTALGGLGGLLGAVTTKHASNRFGSARWLLTSTAVSFPFGVLIPLTHYDFSLAGYVAGTAMISAAVTSYNIIAVSYTQTICPPRMLGRVHSAKRVMILGTATAGSILSGAMGNWIGIRPALTIIMAILLTVPLALCTSSLRSRRELPTDPDADAAQPPRRPLPH